MAETHARVVVVGGAMAGKSALVVRFVQDMFVEVYDPTIEDAYRKAVSVHDAAWAVDILDTAGQDEFAVLLPEYLRGGQAFMVVFSATDRASLTKAATLAEKVLRWKGFNATPMVLVAAKCDLEDGRQVSSREGERVAKGFGVPYVETSAKTAREVNAAFLRLLQLVQEHRANPPRSGPRPQREAKPAKATRHDGVVGMALLLGKCWEGKGGLLQHVDKRVEELGLADCHLTHLRASPEHLAWARRAEALVHLHLKQGVDEMRAACTLQLDQARKRAHQEVHSHTSLLRVLSRTLPLLTDAINIGCVVPNALDTGETARLLEWSHGAARAQPAQQAICPGFPRGTRGAMEWKTVFSLKRNVAPQVARALEAVHFARSGGNSLLDLGERRLGNEGLRDLTPDICTLPRLTKLILNENGLDANSAPLLARVLRTVPALEVLDISENNLGATGAAVLARALPRAERLRILNLSQNFLGPQGALAIALSAQGMERLEVVSLWGNGLDEEDCGRVAGILERVATVRVW